MKSMRHVAAVAIAIVAVGAIAVADRAHAQMNKADATRGRQLADRLCMGCHIVSKDSGATTTNPDVPSFEAIAKRPDSTAERLAGRIIVPHPAMPTTQLTVGEIRDLIAYILTLKPAR